VRNTRNLVAPAAEEIVKARDAAIVAALKVRPWKYEGLLSVLPTEPGQTPAQRETALTSALIRLKTKKLVEVCPEGYRLAS
jgi:hypothetical protein